ncbi:hypothetical protein FB451DRAFT_1388251 [Mycena latifolia]|nr:hypothetical protein FB451DRAFT_1388251 [Mycena latifolia]
MSATITASELKVALDQVAITWGMAMAEAFLYGVYLIMFGFYLDILRTQGVANHRFLTVAIISLFVLCTAHCTLVIATAVVLTRAGSDLAPYLISPSWFSSGRNTSLVYIVYVTNRVYVTSNIVADSIFIFRCYAIWNRRRNVIIFPILLTLAVAGLGYSNDILSLVARADEGLNFLLSMIMSLATTFFVMGLTVGRIWWLARAAREVLGKKVVKKYYTVCAMILESGSLFGVGGIAYIVMVMVLPWESTMTGAVIGQLVGIAPTIIALRVGLRCSVEDVDSFIAPQPRARPLPQLNSGTPSVQSVEERVIYIRPDSGQQDMNDKV